MFRQEKYLKTRQDSGLTYAVVMVVQKVICIYINLSGVYINLNFYLNLNLYMNLNPTF